MNRNGCMLAGAACGYELAAIAILWITHVHVVVR